MKIRTFLTGLFLIFTVEAAVLLIFAAQDTEEVQDAVAVNEVIHSVQADWDAMETHCNRTSLDYVVLDSDGRAVFKTRSGLSESVNAAIIHRDTILDVPTDRAAGKIIIYNDSPRILGTKKQNAVIVLLTALFLQFGLCISLLLYWNHAVIKPFHRLKGFAERIACGNLDIPLEMDRQNLFGAFTESFDIMRSELKKARMAEAKANADKKELVAKLSHDIKTPAASIKAASELGIALADDGRIKDNYLQIIRKADQINTLITNLFTASMEELDQLPVTPQETESSILYTLLENSDYLHLSEIPVVPHCILYMDTLRLQQVFDNLFANSYKYADTKIDVSISKNSGSLAVSIEDYGGGVSREELPLLKEKFKRGTHVKHVEGAGLGLFISDYFMSRMGGSLLIENGRHGLKATVVISFAS